MGQRPLALDLVKFLLYQLPLAYLLEERLVQKVVHLQQVVQLYLDRDLLPLHAHVLVCVLEAY